LESRLLCLSCSIAKRPLCENVTSSTKPEINIISQRRERQTESRPQTTCTKKFGEVWPYGFRVMRADRQTDTLITMLQLLPKAGYHETHNNRSDIIFQFNRFSFRYGQYVIFCNCIHPAAVSDRAYIHKIYINSSQHSFMYDEVFVLLSLLLVLEFSYFV